MQLKIKYILLLKGEGEHSEVNEAHTFNFFSLGHYELKIANKYGVTIHVKKLGGATC